MGVVVAAIGTMDVAVLGLEVGLDLGAARGAIGDVGLGEEEVDDLVLIERGAQLGGCHRLLLNVLDEAIAVGRLILLRGLSDEALHFLVGDLDAVGLADLAQQQAKADAALGDLTVVVLVVFDLGLGGFGIGLVAGFMVELRHDVGEFGLDHRRRHFEVMARGQLVEQAALHVGAGEAVQLLRLLVAQQALSWSRLSRPRVLAKSSSILVSPAVFTAVTLTSNVTGLPLRFSAG